MTSEDIIISNHARIRAAELGIPEESIKNLLLDAKRQRVNADRELYKFSKYGYKKQQKTDFYLRKATSKYPKLLFTVTASKDKFIIITITKK